ncbi:MAG: sulfurtransferase TusA family protein [Pseudomonadota bacterium]
MTDVTLDAIGLLCPLPVLKARKALGSLEDGAILEVRATDPASAIDIPHFCSEAGHALLSSDKEGEVLVYRIKKGG